MKVILFYMLDMAAAIAGFKYGFGLEVQNWWALIGFMLLARFIIKGFSINKVGGQHDKD